MPMGSRTRRPPTEAGSPAAPPPIQVSRAVDRSPSADISRWARRIAIENASTYMCSMKKIIRTLSAIALASLAFPAAAAPTRDTAVLAGGCFWGMEGVFEHVKGVTNVVSGYAGGTAADATYDKVSSERTRHAETVRISFDPRQVELCTVCSNLLFVAHDSTQVNRQGPDVGPSYRSDLPAERHPAQIAQLHRAATRGKAADRNSNRELSLLSSRKRPTRFHAANPLHPYVLVNDRPSCELKKDYRSSGRPSASARSKVYSPFIPPGSAARSNSWGPAAEVGPLGPCMADLLPGEPAAEHFLLFADDLVGVDRRGSCRWSGRRRSRGVSASTARPFRPEALREDALIRSTSKHTPQGLRGLSP